MGGEDKGGGISSAEIKHQSLREVKKKEFENIIREEVL